MNQQVLPGRTCTSHVAGASKPCELGQQARGDMAVDDWKCRTLQLKRCTSYCYADVIFMDYTRCCGGDWANMY